MSVLRNRVKGHVALVAPRLGGLPVAPADLEAQREGVAALFTRVAELKGTEVGVDARVVSGALADRIVAVVLDHVGHDLSRRRARLSDAAHFGRLVGLTEPTLRGFEPDRAHPHAATALLYVAVQAQDDDQLFEQLTVWALQAGYWLTRTGTDSHALLAELRAQIVGLLGDDEQAPTVPPQRRADHDSRAARPAGAAVGLPR
ncbi:MAG: hypothetical protein ACT4QF_22525 [Sporichthyaceae bacterium]